MKKGMKNGLPEKTDELFGRVAAILEQARGNVVLSPFYTVCSDRVPEIRQIVSGVLTTEPMR